MTVVKVRTMGMRVCLLRVTVLMSVPDAGREVRMSVIVVTIVVPVIVRVGLRTVVMVVLVSRPEHQSDARRHQPPSHDLTSEYSLS